MDQLKLLTPEQIKALSIEQLQVIMNNKAKDKIPELKSLISQLNYGFRPDNNIHSQKELDECRKYNDNAKKTNEELVPKILKILHKHNDEEFYIIYKNLSDLKCFTKEEISNIIPEEIINEFIIDSNNSYENYKFFNKKDFLKKHYTITNIDFIRKSNNLHVISIDLLEIYAHFQVDPSNITNVANFINKL
jgi:hypothetical protein